MPDRVKFRRLFGLYNNIVWLLRDDFNDVLAAGSVNGTLATPGPGTRTVTDAENKYSIGSGVLNSAGGKVAPAIGDPGLWYSAQTRAAGKIFIFDVTPTLSGGKELYIGLDSNTSSTPSLHAVDLNNTLLYRYDNALLLAIAPIVTATNYKLAFVLRASGCFYFIKGGAYTNWSLLCYSKVLNTTPLYPCYSNYNEVFTSDFVRIPQNLWLPTPLASDSFDRADGAIGSTDGAGHAESTGLGSGGAGLPWTGGSISGNAMIITPTLGVELAAGNLVVGTWYSITATEVNHFFTGCAVGNTFRALAATALDANNKVKEITLSTTIASLPTLNTVNVMYDVEVSVLTAGNQAGGIARLDSSVTPANFIQFDFDGQGNVKCTEYVAGVPAELITAVKAFTASDHLILSTSGAAIRLYHMTAAGLYALIGSANTNVLTGTLYGAFSTDPTNKINSIVAYSKGNGGEYAELDKYIK